MGRSWKELTSVVLVFSMLALALPTSPAVAGWAPTRPALDGPRARLVSVLEREEIARTFAALGVDPVEAVRRVSGLTDAEAQLALERLDQVPSGGGAIEAVIGAALLIFFVLLLTDLLGLTHVFPFTKRH